MPLLWRWLKALPLLVISPLLVLVPALALALTDLLWWAFGRRRARRDSMPSTASASVVIPNWNGRDLLEKYLPSVVAAMQGNAANEVIVVDNGSTDGSADFVRARFPSVRLIALNENLGFGGGSNTGFREAKNDIVVLLNSDMRVAPDFLPPLLAGFTDASVFAVSCQIFFSDPAKKREETGLTQAWWADGGLRVRHRDDGEVTGLYPCFYGGGGSCAFDRRKFLELGGFDEVLRPFYLEDTDLGMMAWKRGWKVFYQPASHVWHEHRGTIGKKFSQEYIQSMLKKNFILFCWKNLGEWPKLASHFAFSWSGAVLSLLFGDSPERSNLAGMFRAALQIPGACGARWRARSLAEVSDTEAFRRPLGGYFRDRFEPAGDAAKPRVLFVSPYAIEPPIHGGAVFMSQTVRELARHTDLHLIALLDTPGEAAAHEPLKQICASVSHLVRIEGRPHSIGSLAPFAVREFANADLDWLIHRQIYQHKIDVLQLEYTNIGQYAGHYQHVVNAVFEHDVYFQSVRRILSAPGGKLTKLSVFLEYLRALRYELKMLRHVDHAQMCTASNRDYVLGFAPDLAPKLEPGLRAGITASQYAYREEGRQPDTILFVGSFRHAPNQEALFWFLRGVFWRVLEKRPQTKLVIVGSDPPDRHALPHYAESPHGDPIVIRGFVEDVREAFAEYAVFICPILSGSGVRVKLLEAFACGIPCVSTVLGAEGLAMRDGELCHLTDDPVRFAEHLVELLDRPDREMTRRARREVETNWDMPAITARLAARYRELIARKNR